VAISHQLGDNTNDNLSLPGTDSQRATDTLSKSFPAQSNGTSPIVFHVKNGNLTDSKYANAINSAAADVAKTPHVASVVNPLTPAGASALSKDKGTAYMSVTTSVSPGSLSVEDAQKIVAAAKGPTEKVGIEVQTGGVLCQKISKPATESSELIGILAAMFILTFTFGTVVAMLLPIVTAIFSLVTTLSIIRLLEHVATVPTVAPTLATMIGLGVGIDYALFIVTRHFRGMHDGLEIDESIARSAATSGGAVFFAGGTVTIALVSLAVAGIPIVTTMGLMAAVAVIVAVCGALTLLPAVLAILGPRINSLKVRDLHPEEEAKKGLWAKWAHEIAKQPILAGACRARDPHPAHDPAAVPVARAAGHGGAVEVDRVASGVRPDRPQLRRRCQRPAAARRAPRIPSAAGEREFELQLQPEQVRVVGRLELEQQLQLEWRSADDGSAPDDAPEGHRRHVRRAGRDSDPARQGRDDGVLQRDPDPEPGRQEDHGARQ
jgi:RND superfamily putative drug exporter